MRSLTDNEAQLLMNILGVVEAGEKLADQVGCAHVSDDSTPTFLRLVVEDGAAATSFADGPIPGRFPVSRESELLGEILVWVKGGRLSAIEYAWVTDAAPTQMPEPSEVELPV
jgi:hypothetical protein